MMILLIGGLLIFALIIYKNFEFKKKDSLTFRRDQLENWTKRNVLSEKLKETVPQNWTKATKRIEIEMLAHRAGFHADYYTILLYRIVLGLLFLVLSAFFISNIFLMLVFGFMGYILPVEVLKIFQNVRLQKLEDQLGTFMKMATKRYQSTGDFKEAMKMTAYDLRGEEPIYSEIMEAVDDIELGVPMEEALSVMADKSGNKFFQRFAVYYQIAAEVGTADIRNRLLDEAIDQYDENKQMKRRLRKAIREPIFGAYLMIALVPGFVLFGMATLDNYTEVMTKTLPGQLATAFIVSSIIFSLWMVNTKIGAPLDTFGDQGKSKKGAK